VHDGLSSHPLPPPHSRPTTGGGGEESVVVASGEDSVDGEEVKVEEEEDANDFLDAGMAMNARSNSVLKIHYSVIS
jgi:hypothetical protein